MSTVDQAYSIFQQPWWLDATARGRWDVVDVDESGTTVARLPFTYGRRLGMTHLSQPQLTQTLGPWLESSEESAMKRLAREHDLLEKLITRLPRFELFSQSLHPNLTNWLPFHWHGFSSSLRCTYVINDLQDMDANWAALKPKVRSTINQARKKLTVTSDQDLSDFFISNESTYRRQGLEVPYSRDLVESVDAGAREFAQRLVLTARDDDGIAHASVYIVGDNSRMYLLMSGVKDNAHPGAGSLVTWEAVSRSAKVSRVFDFEGSMIRGVEFFYRGFGGTQTAFITIRAARRLGKVASAARQLRA